MNDFVKSANQVRLNPIIFMDQMKTLGRVRIKMVQAERQIVDRGFGDGRHRVLVAVEGRRQPI